MQRILILFALVCILFSAAQAQAPQKRTLDNGLTILVQENHSAPVAAVRFYVKTGSIYEGQYLGSGISHLYEHLLSEGTATRTKEQINNAVQGIGGQSNAYTSNHLTAYFITTASRYFDPALEILADQMQNATFPEAEVKTQQGVIHNEMNMGEDDPNRVLWKLYFETAFHVHPVRYPVIGHREIFDRLSRQDMLTYYDMHYTPENTVLSVAGAVRAEEVFEAAQKYLGEWERRSPQTPVLPTEPRQVSPRRAVVEKDVQLAQTMMGWHTIPLQHPDLYALDVLAQVLGGGESSRLVRSLREEQNLVVSIGAFSSTPSYGAGVFGVRSTLSPQNLPKLENALLNEIEKIKNQGVTQEEVQRAQRQMETSFVFVNEDVADQAERIAYDFIGTGDPSYSEHYVERIKRVTPDQVRQMAWKYLLASGLTTAIVQPRAQTGVAALPDVNDPVSAVAATQSTQTVVSPSHETAAPPQMTILPNGMRLIIRENRASPTVAIVAMGLGGARLEPQNQAGIGNLATEMLTRGTRTRTAEEIAQLVDSLGGSLGTTGGYNSWVMSSQWLARDWRRGLSLMQESLLTPTFPADELTRVKTRTLASIKAQEDDPNSTAGLLLRGTFFQNHPYGRSQLGNAESIAGITNRDLHLYWSGALRPSETVLAVYGDVEGEEVKKVVEYLFRNVRPINQPRTPPAPPAPLASFTAREELKPGLAQSVIMYAFPGVIITSEDRHAIEVLDGALSGIYYPGGRLHARLRDNQLVYGVHAYNSGGIDTAMFVVQAATTKDKRLEVQSIIEEEIKRIRDENITAAELERAKSMAIASRAISLQTNAAQAGNVVADELFGLGYRADADYEEKINAITADEVRRVAQKYLLMDNAARAVVEATE